MGSQLSQSQQIKNVFPTSQYKLLQNDKNFPNLTIFQNLSDSSNVALLVSDQLQAQGKNCSSDHVLKIIDRKKIGKSNLEIYQWANTHVQGLVEYITHIDKSRSISKSQFYAILEGAIKGYTAISQQVSPNQCLNIDMRCLRIFHSISLKNDTQNRKQIVDYMHVKVVPKKISQNLQTGQNKSSNWSKIGSCIHKGGIHTEQQLLGHYMLKLSGFITKTNFKDNKDNLKNISDIFGRKIQKVIQNLLENKPWKRIIQTLNGNELSEIQSLKLDSKQQLSLGLTKSRESISTNRIETNKQISIQKIQSQKNLFRCFQKQARKNQQALKGISSAQKQLTKNDRILNEKNTNICQQKTNANQTQKIIKRDNQFLQFKCKSPQSRKVGTEKAIRVGQNAQPINSSSVKVIKQIVSAQKSKIKLNNCSPRLTRANSILTIYPDVFRNESQNRSRILSTKIIENQIRSPQNIKEKTQNFNSPSKSNISQLILKGNVSQTEIKTPRVQKPKGKPISFQPSQINSTLKSIQIPVYLVKTLPDINKNCLTSFQQVAKNNTLRIK